MPVAQAAPAALEQHEPLAVGGDLTDRLGRRRAVLELDNPLGHRAQRHGDDDVAGILARRAGTGSVLSVLGELVALVLEVDQRPVLSVALQHDAAALAAVAAVGTAEGHELLAPEMGRTRAAVARAGENLHVVYEIGTCHNLFFLAAKIVQAACNHKFISRRRSPAKGKRAEDVVSSARSRSIALPRSAVRASAAHREAPTPRQPGGRPPCPRRC